MDIKSELGALLSFVAEGVILFDNKGRINFINPHASLLLDYLAEDITGKHIDKAFKIYLNNKLIDSRRGVVYHVFKLGETFVVPHRGTIYFQSRSGRKFPVFVSAKTVEIKNKKTGVLIFRDITVKKELESYKLNTTKKLAKLTPALQEIATGNFSVKVNIPKKEDEFTELTVGLQLMIDDLMELEKTRKRNERKSIEAVKKSEEIKRRLTEKYSKELEVKVMEKTKELKQSKVHIETVIENLTNGLIEYTSDCSVVRINRVAEELLGVKRKKVIGRKITPKDIKRKNLRSLAEVSYPALSEGARKLDKDITGVDNDIHEISIKRPLERELQVTTAPIISHSTKKRKGFIKVIRDITREKIISRSKSEFISIAAHQLRTPLSAIKWALRMLLDGDVGQLSLSQIELLNSGYKTNEKMIQLVNDLLNVARIEEGRFGYEFGEDDIVKLISSTIKGLSLVAKNKGINLIFKSPDIQIKPFVFDIKRMGLVLQNLIDNSIKYTLAGGEVRVAIEKRGRYVWISVSDTGVGIPKHQIAQMFTKFFRGENVMRIQTSGSGLGLFIAKNIVVRHGGEMKLQSEENKGSVFSFSLPLSKSLIPKEDRISYG